MSDFWEKFRRREEIGRMIWPIYVLIAVILFLIINHFNSARLEQEQQGSKTQTSQPPK
jgi:large-conductance mechanosensitive channel